MLESNRQQGEDLLRTNQETRQLVEVVSAAAYLRFGRWMDDELAQLVDRWQHLAAPRANRPPRRTLPTPPE